MGGLGYLELVTLPRKKRKRMGIFWSSKTQVKVCVVGLDNSGKSTIPNQMKPDKVSINEVTPTIGFTTENSHTASVRLRRGICQARADIVNSGSITMRKRLASYLWLTLAMA